MAVNFNFIDDDRGVEILASGIVYGHEVITANQEIANSRQLATLEFHIIDKSKCTEYNVSADDMFEISKYDQVFTAANPNIVMAIIESKSLRYSLSILWQCIVKKQNLNNKSFVDRASALEWINQQMRGFSTGSRQ